MPLTDAVPSSAPDVLVRNANDLDLLVNSAATSATNRIGATVRTFAGIQQEASDQIARIGFEQPTAYSTSGQTLLRVTQTVTNGGVIYAPAYGTTFPFITSGTFNAALWRPISSDGILDLAASSGASLVGYMPSGSSVVASTVQSKLRERVSVKDYGAKGDYVQPSLYVQGTGTDDTIKLQLAATKCDTEGNSYWFMPNHHENYLISAPIVFSEPGVRIFGEGGARAHYRGTPLKNGSIYAKAGTSTIFDLGASRTTGNPADQWTIENIAMASVTADYLTNGITFTSKTDGPDRGAVIRQCSGSGLNHAVSVPSRGTQTSLANLIVENCVYNGNRIAIAALSGQVAGARIVGNQLEQNYEGAIVGGFTGGVLIADNMLEGQPNAVNVTIPEVIGGNRTNIVFERNYMESNTGDYVLKFNIASSGSLTVRDNYWLPNYPTDKIVLTGNANCLLTVREKLFGFVPVTFDNYGGGIEYGSDFLDNVGSYFLVRRISTINYNPNVITGDYEKFIGDLTSTKIDSAESGLAHFDTPYGNMLCSRYGEYILNGLTIAAGDMYTLNIFCQFDVGAICTIQVWNLTKTAMLRSFDIVPSHNGRWGLLTAPIWSAYASTGIFVRIIAGSGNVGNCKIAGILAINNGSFSGDGVATKSISPMMPNRVVMQQGSNYNQTSASGSVSIIDTAITLSTVTGIDYVSRYSLTAKGATNAAATTETAIAYGDITVINGGSAFSIAYVSQGSAGSANPITVSAVFWDGVTETTTTTNTSAQIRIKISGYLNNTGYQQACRLVKTI